MPSYVDDVEIIAGTVEYITLSTENPQAKFYSGLYTLQDLESQAWEGDKHSIYYSTTDKKLYRCTAAGYEQGDTSTWVQTTVTEIFGSVTYGKYFVVGDKTIRIIDGEPVSVSQFEKIIPGSTDRPLTDFEEDKVYLTFDNKTYRWNGYETMSHPVEKWGQLVVIGSDLALGETASTAYRGDRGKIAYDHSQSTGNPHGTTPAQIGAEPAFSKNTAFNKNFETNASNIKMNGTASAGSSTKVARADHVHPTDTSREPAIPAGNANQYWAGNKTWKNMPTSLPANGGNADTAGKLSSSRNFAITGDAVGTASSNLESGVSINVELKASGVVQGTYSAVSVNSKGIVTGGGYMVEIGTAGQTVPSDSLAVGGLFFKEV